MTKYEPKTGAEVGRPRVPILHKVSVSQDVRVGFDLLNDLAHAEACLQEREVEIERLRAKSCEDGCRFNQSMKEYNKQLEELTCPTS